MCNHKNHHKKKFLTALFLLLLAYVFLFPVGAEQVPGESIEQTEPMDKIYWTDLTTNKIMRTDIDGTGTIALVTGLSNPMGIALDVSAAKIYWIDQSSGKIYSVNLDGTNQTELVTGLSKPTAIALTSSKIYWTDTTDYKIYSVNLDGTNQTELVTNASSSGIAVTNSKIYWTDYSADRIRSADLTGSNQTDLATTGSSPSDIVVTSSNIYWTDTLADKIQYAPLAGGAATDLIATGLNTPRGIALNPAGTQIYWTESNGGEIEVADLQNNSISNRKTLISVNAWNIALLIGKSEPGQPTSLSATPNTDGTVTLSWTAPTNNGGYSITGYVITQTGQANNTYNTTGTSYTTPVLANGNYSFTVAAKNAVGTSSSSSSDLADILLKSTADAVQSLSSAELLLLNGFLTYDTILFNELHNASDDTNDWLELRNVSGADMTLDDWQLTIRTGVGDVILEFPVGTVIPADEVLLLVNTEATIADAAASSIVSEMFALPQSDFALILRGPTAFGDLAGNYFESESERPETAPAFTVDTVWYRVTPITFGYRAEAWAESTSMSSTPWDVNADGTVDILDLVLVAGQFGQSGESLKGDVNGDGAVDILDLVAVSSHFGEETDNE